MKEAKHWMLINKHMNPILINGQLPIYWMKRVAEREAKKYKATVVSVFLSWKSTNTDKP